MIQSLIWNLDSLLDPRLYEKKSKLKMYVQQMLMMNYDIWMNFQLWYLARKLSKPGVSSLYTQTGSQMNLHPIRAMRTQSISRSDPQSSLLSTLPTRGRFLSRAVRGGRYSTARSFAASWAFSHSDTETLMQRRLAHSVAKMTNKRETGHEKERATTCCCSFRGVGRENEIHRKTDCRRDKEMYTETKGQI